MRKLLKLALARTGAKVGLLDALKKNGLRNKVKIEVSGGITHKNIKRYASVDVDMISIGSITHSVKSVDMSLEIIKT